MITFTRIQLYDLVWSKPIRTIASEHGINAIKLAQACDEQNIPRPAAGYWQKLEHGKPTEKTELDEGHGSGLELVQLRRIDRAAPELAIA